MKDTKLILDSDEYELPIVVGSEGEVAVDVRSLRKQSGAITLRSRATATPALCRERDHLHRRGDRGSCRYRGYPIEEVAVRRATSSEVCYLLVYGRAAECPREYAALPRAADSHHSLLHEDMKKFFEGVPADRLIRWRFSRLRW